MARIKYYDAESGEWKYADQAHSSDSSQNANGLSAEASVLLITILRNGVYSIDQSANITALAEVLAATEEEAPDIPVEPDDPEVPEVTLTSISATYSGGNVAAGTAVTAMTGVVVTAHYSDGTSKTVTGYTLNGNIAEGSNTVTVSYGGKTTTFTVVGVAGEESSTWVVGHVNTSGGVLYAEGYLMNEEYFPIEPGQKIYLSNYDRSWKGTSSFWGYYDADKNFISRTSSDSYVNGWILSPRDSVPDNAAFVRVSCNNMDGFTDTAIIATELPDVGTPFEETTWSEGYVASSANIGAETGCWVSWYVNVEAGATYKFGNSVEGWSSGWYGIGVYSDAATQLARLLTAQFTVPDGAKYVRLSAQNMTGYCETATLTKVS